MITKEQMRKFSNDQLLEMVHCAKNHTGKDFSQKFDTDFSYTTLTKELVNRGFENGWHKKEQKEKNCQHQIQGLQQEPDVIKMTKIGTSIRKSYTVDEKTAKEWEKQWHDVPLRSVLISVAMQRLMDDYTNGRVKFEIAADAAEDKD